MRSAGVLVGALAAVVVAACSVTEGDSEPTLAPLVTRSTVAASDPGSSTPETEAETFATPLSVEPSMPPSASSSTLEPRPVADWDGARFDVGRITGVGEVDSYPAIMFDRYSYEDPEAGAVDAGDFTEEPVQYWWIEEPFFNISPTVRTFVLAPDVQVLVLADDNETAACTSPQPDPLPAPSWTAVEASFLDTPVAARSFASLTYADDGLVELIRFMHGCRQP